MLALCRFTIRLLDWSIILETSVKMRQMGSRLRAPRLGLLQFLQPVAERSDKPDELFCVALLRGRFRNPAPVRGWMLTLVGSDRARTRWAKQHGLNSSRRTRRECKLRFLGRQAPKCATAAFPTSRAGDVAKAHSSESWVCFRRTGRKIVPSGLLHYSVEPMWRT